MQLGRNTSQLISEVSITLMPKSEGKKNALQQNKVADPQLSCMNLDLKLFKNLANWIQKNIKT